MRHLGLKWTLHGARPPEDVALDVELLPDLQVKGFLHLVLLLQPLLFLLRRLLFLLEFLLLHVFESLPSAQDVLLHILQGRQAWVCLGHRPFNQKTKIKDHFIDKHT